MHTIDYVILFIASASFIFALFMDREGKKREQHLIDKWAEAEQECATWISMYQDELAQNRILSKELEQYRNHQEEA
jgi:hypothetical protein